MRWATFIGAVLFTVIILSSISAKAHPGNTASDGGHYCWTRCEYWGYTYGTRHFHGNYSAPTTSPDYTEQGRLNGIDHANTKNRTYIVNQAEVNGDSDGYKDGYNGSYSSPSPPSTTTCDDEIKFDTTPPLEYKSAFQLYYEIKCTEIYKGAYSSAYLSSYKKGESAKSNSNALSSSDAESEKNENWVWLVPLGIYGLPMLAGGVVAGWDKLKNWVQEG